MFKNTLVFLLCCFFWVSNSNAQDTLIVQGTITTTTSASTSMLPVVMYALDSNNIIDSANTITDSMGNYSDTLIDSNILQLIVKIPSCTPPANEISKTRQITLQASGITYETVDFTKFCFEANFSYYNITDTVSFNSNVSGGLAPYTYYWDFGDTSLISNFSNPVHLYSGGPLFTVELCVVDTVLDTTCTSKQINIDDCQSQFNYTSLGSKTIQFNNTSLSVNNPEYLWDFGDFNTDSSQSPIHLYSNYGTYLVSLSVIDSAANCTDVSKMLVQVDSSQCLASFNILAKNNIVSFTNNSTSSSIPSALTYSWNYDDGSLLDNSDSPVKVYTNNGNYNVSLSIFDTIFNCRDTAYGFVSVNSLDSTSLILSGRVSQNFVGNSAFIELISDLSGVPKVLDTMSTFEEYYSFPIDANNVYYVRANADSTHQDFNLIPSIYYEDAMIWNNARAIVVGTENSFDNDIQLTMSVGQSGSSRISGKVTRNESGKPIIPLPNVKIMLFNANGDFLFKTETDQQGEYEFQNIESGTFIVNADVIGKTSYSTTVIVGAAQSINNIDFTIFDDHILSLKKEEIIVDNWIDIYPNPAQNKVMLFNQMSFDFKGRIYVINSIGNNVITRDVDIRKGDIQKFELDQIPSGLYFFHLVGDDHNETIRVIKE